MKIILLLIILLNINPINGQSINFISSDRFVLGNYKERTASLDVGDIDNDGDQDIIVANGRH